MTDEHRCLDCVTGDEWNAASRAFYGAPLPKNDQMIPYGYNGPVGDTEAMIWFMDNDPHYLAVMETDKRRAAELEDHRD